MKAWLHQTFASMTPRASNVPGGRRLLSLTLAILITLPGCTLLPMKTLKPIIAPPALSLCPKNPAEQQNTAEQIGEIGYILPSDDGAGPLRATNQTTASSFDDYRQKVKDRIDSKLPIDLAEDHVTVVFRDFLTAGSGEAQLAAQYQSQTQLAQLAAQSQNSDAQAKLALRAKALDEQKASIEKHYSAPKLKQSELKKFATKLFELQLRHGPADFLSSDLDAAGLTSQSAALAKTRPKLGSELISYLKAYYDGDFYDRMGTSISKPQLPTSLKSLSNFSVPDSEIVAAETVLLEFLIDSIDRTPVMGDKDGHPAGTTYYPGGTTNEPTALAANYATYLFLQPDSCGINQKNVWVLKDLANAASDQAAAVGGLIVNTPGGISIGLGVLGKISIGDNQTLSDLVKTAASELALRATLTASYFALKNVKFNPPNLPKDIGQ